MTSSVRKFTECLSRKLITCSFNDIPKNFIALGNKRHWKETLLAAQGTEYNSICVHHLASLALRNWLTVHQNYFHYLVSSMDTISLSSDRNLTFSTYLQNTFEYQYFLLNYVFYPKYRCVCIRVSNTDFSYNSIVCKNDYIFSCAFITFWFGDYLTLLNKATEPKCSNCFSSKFWENLSLWCL